MAVISENMISLLNYRIEQEEMSSRLYKAMSVWLNKNGFLGASKLWAKYSSEEAVHAQWAYEYLLDLNILPNVPQLEKPQADFKSLQNIIALSLKHEYEILDQLQSLAKEANLEMDFMTLELAQRYLKEQVEEIAKTTTFVDELEAFGTGGAALRLFDNKMGEMA